LPAPAHEAPIIGTLERVPLKQIDEEMLAKASALGATEADASSPLVADLQQRP